MLISTINNFLTHSVSQYKRLTKDQKFYKFLPLVLGCLLLPRSSAQSSRDLISRRFQMLTQDYCEARIPQETCKTVFDSESFSVQCDPLYPQLTVWNSPVTYKSYLQTFESLECPDGQYLEFFNSTLSIKAKNRNEASKGLQSTIIDLIRENNQQNVLDYRQKLAEFLSYEKKINERLSSLDTTIKKAQDLKNKEGFFPKNQIKELNDHIKILKNDKKLLRLELLDEKKKINAFGEKILLDVDGTSITLRDLNNKLLKSSTIDSSFPNSSKSSSINAALVGCVVFGAAGAGAMAVYCAKKRNSKNAKSDADPKIRIKKRIVVPEKEETSHELPEALLKGIEAQRAEADRQRAAKATADSARAAADAQTRQKHQQLHEKREKRRHGTSHNSVYA